MKLLNLKSTWDSIFNFFEPIRKTNFELLRKETLDGVYDIVDGRVQISVRTLCRLELLTRKKSL